MTNKGIPKGPYCYTPKQTPCKENGWVYGVNMCPHFNTIEDDGVVVVRCEYLKENGLTNDMTDEEFKILVKKYGSEDEVFDAHPLFLLWDSVKECGENWPDEEEENAKNETDN